MTENGAVSAENPDPLAAFNCDDDDNDQGGGFAGFDDDHDDHIALSVEVPA